MTTASAAPRSRLPGLDALWEGRLSDWEPLRAAGVPEGRRLLELHPGRRAVVSLPGRPGIPGASLFLFAEPEAARTFFRQSLERVSREGDVFLNRELAAVLWRHPFDPTLRAMAALDEPAWRRDLLRQLEPEEGAGGDDSGPDACRWEEWVPEQHASVGLHVGQGARRRELQLVVFSAQEVEDAVRAHQLLAGLSDQGEPFEVPRLLRYLEGRNLLIRERVAAAGTGHWSSPWAVQDLGRALGRLHRAAVELPHRRSPPEEGEAIRRRAGELAELAPDLGPRLQAVGETLGERICLLNLSPSAVMLDGLELDRVGCRAGQVVWREPGQARRGPAALDLGALKVGLEGVSAPVEALWDGYRDSGATVPQAAWVVVAEAWARFRQVDAPLRHLAPDWTDAMSQALTRLEGLLEEGTP